MDRKYIKITADFSPEADATLTLLASRLHTSKGEVLQKALGLINFLSQHKEDGWTILVKKGDVEKEIIKF
jgi:hypothetical protein